MDGLAMALNIAYNSKNPIEDLTRTANLGGDCDSMAAIVGTLSGAIHGLTEELWKYYKDHLIKWDNCTIAARALKLIRNKSVKRVEI